MSVTSSTALTVSWDSVPEQSQNGIIIMYEVKYEPQETFEGLIGPVFITTTAMYVTLSNLQEYIAYNVSVRAYTSAGPGPFSIEVVKRTLENGEMIFTLLDYYKRLK